MVKVALLIGVGEYESGLTPLPAAAKDVEAMHRVLLHPEMGGFDDVTPLINPRRQAMEEAIETLFAGRQKDDLVLLFFSGHGIKDEGGRLYFATRNTRKNEKGGLVQATAVSANFVQEIMRTKGRSKRQVVILDCCFSGAFAEDMLVRDDGSVDVMNQLGGEGRAVLTSSTSTQYSFEQKESNLSIYTRYLVEGIETGAADTNDNGVITVDELHEYARKKVRETAPTMSPEIYPIREGYTIVLAKAPLGDPKLRYRKEVERFSRAAEISPIGRKALEELQVKLKLSSEIATAIENEALQPYRDYQKRLQNYEQALLEELQRNSILSSNAQDELQRFQQILGLRDEDIAPIKEKHTKNRVDEKFLRRRNINFRYYIGACIIGVIGVFVGGTLAYFFIGRPNRTHVIAKNKSCDDKEQYSLGDRISLGEEIFLKQDTNSDSDKQTAVQAFASGDCQTAVDKFTSYRKANLRNPEALIYLNNAKARQTKKWLKIAVTVPIDNDPDLAEEILRGVAQAQDEVNNDNKGINNQLLLVAIANDDEQIGSSKKIAKALVEDRKVLGVVGAASSNATLEAGNIFNTEELVAISPTSTSVNISNFSPYIFRTVFSDEVAGKKLANYMGEKLHKKKAAVFSVFSSDYSKSLTEQFVKYVENPSNSKVLRDNEFDLSKSDFNPKKAVKKAISQGAEVLMLASTKETQNNAYEVIKAANNSRLNILAGDNLYSQETLNYLGQQAEGMVVAIPWHINNPSNLKFVENSKKLWNAPVSWRTATAYDATLAIAKGLEQSTTHKELQNTLHSAGFSVDGATGKIEFKQSGDRKDNSISLVKVQKKSGTDQYEFVPIP
ncbi:hypothetical protein CDG76_19010 [Nostoc sp. 'Peltigera membranacea cyanobiont' 210A]|uniref:caspase, EACC1-associated type n=1 Tax=Nostoc sp. 'Peltigera membranacea cyanobiont' 210A TaxID=2014529 RepID=UPI000B957BB6|nr:ABC transporter substrate-binding protein [Nostoc sp. 'Peltigera membranacea cyanobiont' 210A]OYD94031.1 hypothetical protein CDG76_19010 [Nostoc sp. 'Peltigera membranacea cyanobiont' 210A]